MKKSVALLLIFIMATMVACSNNSDGGQTPAKNTGENPSAPAKNDGESKGTNEPTGNTKNMPSYWVEGGAEVSVFTYPSAELTYPEDWPIYQWIKADTNVTVKPVVPAGEYADALALTMASGDIPDVMYLRHYEDANEYGTQGAFVALNEHLDQMPNLKKYWEEYPQVKQKATASDGNVYLAVSEGMGYTNGRGWLIREDVLTQLGKKPPTTWDEMYEIAKAYKEQNPESYPLVWRRHVKDVGYLLAPTFGAGWDFYQDPKSGEVFYGPHSENYKNLLTELNRWYTEGLIPPDWLSMNTKVWTELMATNQSIITPDYLGRVDYLNSEFANAGLKGNMMWMAPPQGKDGERWVGDFAVSNNGLAVFANAKNLEASLKYVDFLFSEKGAEVSSWGVEGESFEIVNGAKKYIHADILDDLLEVQTKYGLMTLGAYGSVDSTASLSIIPEEQRERYTKNQDYEWPYNSAWPAFTEDERASMIDLWVNLEGFREQQYAQFIMGERPLSEFDDYVKEAIDDYQFEKIKAVFEKAYSRAK